MNEIMSCDQQSFLSPSLTNGTLVNNNSMVQDAETPHQNANNTETISINSFNSAICLVPITESIVIRGDGNITVFGVFNSFSKEFPSKLAAKLAPEEYRDTIEHVNKILKKELFTSGLIDGSLEIDTDARAQLVEAIKSIAATKWEDRDFYEIIEHLNPS
jgi:hypothetical protein